MYLQAKGAQENVVRYSSRVIECSDYHAQSIQCQRRQDPIYDRPPEQSFESTEIEHNYECGDRVCGKLNCIRRDSEPAELPDLLIWLALSSQKPKQIREFQGDQYYG